MEKIDVLILHPQDSNLKSLVDIFKERGDSTFIAHSWDEVDRNVYQDLKIAVIDNSYIKNDTSKIKYFLPKTKFIFTDSQSIKKGKKILIDNEKVFEIHSPPYNRYIIEKAIADNFRNLPKTKDGKSKRLHKFQFPLRTKITFPYLFLALAFGVFGAFIVTRIIFDTIQDRFNNQLLEAGKINHEWMVNKETSLLETTRFIANIEKIDLAIGEQDVNTLRNYVYPIAVNEQIDSIRIINDQGLQLISLNHKKGGNIEEYNVGIAAEDFSSFQVVNDILQHKTDILGDKYSGIYKSASGDILYIGGPIYSEEGSFIGMVLTGEYIDSLVDEMRASTLTQVTIYYLNGEIESSTLDLPITLNNNLAANIINDQDQGSHMRSFDIYDITYGEVLSPLNIRGREVVGILGNALAKNFLLYSSFVTQSQIIVFMVLAILMVLIIGLIISRIVSNPLIRLIDASKEVATGNYLVNVDAASGDEIGLLAGTFNQMVSAIQDSKLEIINAYDKSLDGWSRALELRDKETDFHCQRVADLTIIVAKEIGYPPEDLENLRRGALLHDIGKMGIPDNILLKPDTLTDQEWVIMKKHPIFAMNFIKDIPFLKTSYEIPYCHHERWDGSGYPNGLKGEDIPLSARIFAIIDVWDAMISIRPYREPLSKKEIIDYMVRERGKHFEPRIVDAFLKVMKI